MPTCWPFIPSGISLSLHRPCSRKPGRERSSGNATKAMRVGAGARGSAPWNIELQAPPARLWSGGELARGAGGGIPRPYGVFAPGGRAFGGRDQALDKARRATGALNLDRGGDVGMRLEREG